MFNHTQYYDHKAHSDVVLVSKKTSCWCHILMSLLDCKSCYVIMIKTACNITVVYTIYHFRVNETFIERHVCMTAIIWCFYVSTRCVRLLLNIPAKTHALLCHNWALVLPACVINFKTMLFWWRFMKLSHGTICWFVTFRGCWTVCKVEAWKTSTEAG